MSLGQMMVLTPISDQEVYNKQQQMNLSASSSSPFGQEVTLVTSGPDGGVDHSYQQQQQQVTPSFGGEPTWSNPLTFPAASASSVNPQDGVTGGGKTDDSSKRIDQEEFSKAGGKKEKRLSNQDSINKIMIKLAKLEACNDDGYLFLRDGSLSKCSVSQMIRAAMTKSCKQENIDDFIDHLHAAGIDPNLFKNEQFKKKLMARSNRFSNETDDEFYKRVKQIIKQKSEGEKKKKKKTMKSQVGEQKKEEEKKKKKKKGKFVPVKRGKQVAIVDDSTSDDDEDDEMEVRNDDADADDDDDDDDPSTSTAVAKHISKRKNPILRNIRQVESPPPPHPLISRKRKYQIISDPTDLDTISKKVKRSTGAGVGKQKGKKEKKKEYVWLVPA